MYFSPLSQLETENICRVPQTYSIDLLFSNGMNISPHPSRMEQSTLGASFVLQINETQTNVSMTIMPINSAGNSSSDPKLFGELEDIPSAQVYTLLYILISICSSVSCSGCLSQWKQYHLRICRWQ